MSSKLGIAPRGDGPARALVARLTTVVEEHFASLVQLDTTELQSLRVEVHQLRAEVIQLRKVTNGSRLEHVSGLAGIDTDTLTKEATEATVRDMDTLAKVRDIDTVRDIDILAKEATEDLDSFVLKLPEVQLTFKPPAENQRLLKASSIESLDDPDELADAADGMEVDENYLNGCTPVEGDLQIVDAEGVPKEMQELLNTFGELDPEKKGYIDINKLAEYMTKNLKISDDARKNQMHRYRVAVHKLNKALCVKFAHTLAGERREGRGHIDFEAFQELLLGDLSVYQETLGDSIVESLVEIRDTLIDEVIVEEISRTWRVSEDAIGIDHLNLSRCSLERWLEPSAAAMIAVNALVIGCSLDWDPEWNGWFGWEVFFTCFFIWEFVVRVHIHGCADHFFGEDWTWNCFDFLIVCFALLDVVTTFLTKVGSDSFHGMDLNRLSVLRLVRLVRITRLLRLLRFKMFKDLTLLLNGAIAGTRTLLCAFALLSIFTYVLGVLMRQVMDPSLDEFAECGQERGDCNRGARVLGLFGDTMFGTVGRSMLIIFMCFTGGCDSPDGTPLIWHLLDTQGPLLIFGYVVMFTMISFGVLNLIMAIFVEKTLANAQKYDAEREFGEQSQHVKRARELRVLLIKVCKSCDGVVETAHISRDISSKGLRGLYYRWTQKHLKGIEHQELQAHFHMTISREQFEEILLDPEVHNLLDQLDISWSSREQLFDILDADGNGILAISELVDGILKLRGPADKGDGVSTVLTVRHLQKQVCKFEEHMQVHFQVLERLFDKIEAMEFQRI